MKQNPYIDRIDRLAGALLAEDWESALGARGGMRHIRDDNDWIFPDLSRAAFLLAWVWDSPLSPRRYDDRVRARMLECFDRVVAASRGGRWWRGVSGTGDKNISRFTLLPFLETLLLAHSRLGPERLRAAMQVAEEAARFQVRDYHEAPTRKAGEYPNMDAYFMLAMEEAARVLDRSALHRLAAEYLGHLENCLLPGGAFTYYKGTNECEVYHTIDVMTIARYYELTGSARALELLRRTLPYYPNAIEPRGVAECFTDPHWKHMWKSPQPFALDTLATLFPDAPEAPLHRYLANALRSGPESGQGGGSGLYLPWAAGYWRDEPGRAPDARCLRPDPSIRGLRGRFGAFSWAATGGQCVDTFVGAMAARSPDSWSALQAAGVEVTLEDPPIPDPASPHAGRRHARAAYVSGRQYLRRHSFEDDAAAFGAQTMVFPGTLPWQDMTPDSGWVATQVWLMTSERICGLIDLSPSPRALEATEIRAYLRLGPVARGCEGVAGSLACGDLRVRVADHTFEKTDVAPAYTFCLDNDPKSVEIALTTPVPRAGEKPGGRALVEIFPAWEKPSALRWEGLSGGFGFACETDEGRCRKVLFNPTDRVARLREEKSAIPPGAPPETGDRGPLELPSGEIRLVSPR